MVTLLDYIDYLRHNQLQADRQVDRPAGARRSIPSPLLIMITIAAPIGAHADLDARGVGREGVHRHPAGVGFFMLNQLALNAGHAEPLAALA